MGFTVRVQVLEGLVTNRDSGSERELYNDYGGPEGLAHALQTNVVSGLDEKEAQTKYIPRIEEYGTNLIPEKPPRGFSSFFLDAIQDRTLIILMVAAIVSIGLGVGFPPPDESRSTAWIEGTAILIAVFLVSSVTAGNDFSKDRRFRQLSALADNRRIKVIRGGKQVLVSVNDILVGDIVSLETGDFIPADMIYIKGQSLHADEAAMTGEPEAVLKNRDDPFLLSGCMITEGVGKGIVIATGVHSQWGKIKVNLEKPETKTPLQEKLEGLAENIGKGGLLAAIITFAALIFRWAIETVGIKEQIWKWSELGTFVRFIITSITIIVVAVPEGLPLAVTLSLAYSMIKMMKDQNLVRHLAACETMGGATNICSDKTGTLTQNRMTVVRLFVGDQKVNEPPKAFHKSQIHPIPLQLLNEGICINSSAEIENRNSQKPNFIGAKTECALLVMSGNLGMDYQEVRKELEIEKLYPFSSQKKSMSTIVSRGDKGFRCFTKGASEVVLARCTETHGADGEKKSLSSAEKMELLKTINEWASQGLRTLTMAYINLPLQTNIPAEGECPYEKNLILVGIVGIEDPLRPEVPNSVAQCKKAGITVRMLTGDNLLTAKKIAKECGILTNEGKAIEGPEFRKLTIDQMDQLIPRLQVIARCSPDDKLTLVSRLRELGEVVAVTGDGTNDAPALREADVGFAMGISGTEVAKDASDIILLDDNFSSIEKAVLWGRGVYDSIRKFLQFQLTVNVVAVIVAMVGAISDGDSPLKPVQLLWVNLIMDTMAALALATEAPNPELLNRLPHGRHSPLITYKMWRMILGQAIWQFGVLFYLLYGIQTLHFLDCSQAEHDNELKSTIIFNAFVWSQFFNEINSRKLGDEKNVFKGLFKSYIFLGVLVFTAIVQAVIIEFGGDFTKTVGLNWKQWLFCLVIGFMSLPLGLLIRFIPIPGETNMTQHIGVEEVHPLLGKVDHERESNEEPETDDDRLELAVFSDFEHQSRSPSGYWIVAKRVLTQIKVVSAFRRVTPGQRF